MPLISGGIFYLLALKFECYIFRVLNVFIPLMGLNIK